jgi:formamidopyrimidine-DNA glycosylase
MPELPEVEVLVRHLAPRLLGRQVRSFRVLRSRVIRPTPARRLVRALRRAVIQNVSRRGKYLLFAFRGAEGQEFTVLGHLGMTGRMYLLKKTAPLPRHAAVVLDLGNENFIYEDFRYFGRFTLDLAPLAQLGPEPLAREFTSGHFARELARSSQAIKVKLLDQHLTAGIGNIYASEALFRAGISPATPARDLTRGQIERLRRSIRGVLREAIQRGSAALLDFASGKDGLFYYGSTPDAVESQAERFRVYGRAGEPCTRCGSFIGRMPQGGRSTYYCPRCQA